MVGRRTEYIKRRTLDVGAVRGIMLLNKDGDKTFANMDFVTFAKNRTQSSGAVVRAWYNAHGI